MQASSLRGGYSRGAKRYFERLSIMDIYSQCGPNLQKIIADLNAKGQVIKTFTTPS